MKKIFTITFFLFLSAAFINAQISDNKVIKTNPVSPAKDTAIVVQTDKSTQEIYLDDEKQMAIGVNGTINIPTGDFNDFAGMGFGFTGMFFYNLSNNFQLTGTLGYLSWSGDKIEAGDNYLEADGSYTSIPIIGGIRYIFDVRRTKWIPYVGAELGFHIFSNPRLKLVSGDNISIPVKDETNFYFGFGFGGGIIYEINSNVKLDGSLYYNSISGEDSIIYLSLKAGFIISIN